MHEAHYFTTLDAASGFSQVPLTSECSELTTFITPFGQFRFKRLPFGIMHFGARGVSQDNENYTERGAARCDCFVDDVVVWGATKEEHDHRLREVLSRFREQGLRLNPAKYIFSSDRVKYFGHTLIYEEG
jgi:hypothetical protein